MAKSRRVLFFTNSELGQATVCLAVAHEFLLRPEYQVSIASFVALQESVSTLNTCAAEITSGGSSTAIFQTIAGKSMKEAAGRKTEFVEMHPSGFQGALYAYKRVLPATFASWDGPEYVIGYSSCMDILHDIRPDMVVVDPLLSQAIDACNTLGAKFVILSPNTFRDHVIREQPKLSPLWKYPQICTGWPFPLPWFLTLANIFLTIRVVMSKLTSPQLRALTQYRNARGVKGVTPTMFQGFGKEIEHLLPSTPKTDFPFTVPSNFTSCGPILLPFTPLSKSHPDLATWLSGGPTVLVNLGSHILFDESLASEFATALRALLDRRPDVQILWKLKTQGQTRDRLASKGGAFSIIATDIAQGRVRIEDWLPAEPIAILKSGHIICMVHHGGSNSYHEAISAGVVQVVLPVWMDTYDFATRVEWLGIGVRGNRTAAPTVEASELGQALLGAVEGPQSADMREKAKEIAGHVGKVEGRVVACQKIIEIFA